MPIQVPSGGNVAKAIAAGGLVQLERGVNYNAGYLGTWQSGTTFSVYGDPVKPAPVLNANVSFEGKHDITIDGIALHGNGSSAKGLRVLNSQRIKLLNSSVVGYGDKGVTFEGYNGKRCSDILLRNVTIADNFPADASKHSAGAFISFTDGLVIDGCCFSTNGGKPGVETIFNHNCYLHGSNGPATVTNNVFHNGSSHGCQQRSGGVNTGNFYFDNPIGMSYGLVNGEMCFPWGVSGEVARNLILGGGDINGSLRNWGMELSNAKSVVVRDILYVNDTGKPGKAVTVADCARLTNQAQYLTSNHWSLKLTNIYTRNGSINIVAGHPTLNNVGNPPPKAADLRAELGVGFMPWARKFPSLAAPAAINKCFAAAGL